MEGAALAWLEEEVGLSQNETKSVGGNRANLIGWRNGGISTPASDYRLPIPN